MGSYSQAAEFYDLLYSEIKDYGTETARLLEIFGSAQIPVSRVLDVGCGTGKHSQLLSETGLDVDGLDLEPEFVRIAQKRNPAGSFSVGDMTAFEVSQPYDAVTCLFGSIGYAVDDARLRRAVTCLGRAVRRGGLVILEPWFEPGTMEDGYVTMHSARDEGLVVCRVSRTSIVGTVSRLEFHYLIARPSAIEHRSECTSWACSRVRQLKTRFNGPDCRSPMIQRVSWDEASTPRARRELPNQAMDPTAAA